MAQSRVAIGFRFALRHEDYIARTGRALPIPRHSPHQPAGTGGRGVGPYTRGIRPLRVRKSLKPKNLELGADKSPALLIGTSLFQGCRRVLFRQHILA